jgi:hypothetical protein
MALFLLHHRAEAGNNIRPCGKGWMSVQLGQDPVGKISFEQHELFIHLHAGELVVTQPLCVT